MKGCNLGVSRLVPLGFRDWPRSTRRKPGKLGPQHKIDLINCISLNLALACCQCQAYTIVLQLVTIETRAVVSPGLANADAWNGRCTGIAIPRKAQSQGSSHLATSPPVCRPQPSCHPAWPVASAPDDPQTSASLTCATCLCQAFYIFAFRCLHL